MVKRAVPPTATDKEVRALLEHYRCPVPFHEVRARFLLDGNLDQPLGANEVMGRFSDPALQARYQRQQEHRHQQRTGREGAASQNASDYLEERG